MMARLSRRSVLKLLLSLPFIDAALVAANQIDKPISDPRVPNFLIIVFDALSAAHLPLHGYPRSTMPHLSAFADQATVFHAHRSAGSFTTPGTASMLTGAYPWSHRALHIQGTVSQGFADRSLFRLLQLRGYHTMAYTHNLVTSSLLYQFADAIEQLSPIREVALADLNLAEHVVPRDLTVAAHSEGVLTRRGDAPSSSLFLYHLTELWNRFALQEPHQRYTDDYPRGLPGGHNLFFLLETAIDWTMQQLTSMPEPFAAYLHYLPPHDPYNPRREFVGLFDDDWHPPRKPLHPLGDAHPREFLDGLRRQYDEHIAYVDSEFGRLAEFLRSSGLSDTTYVFVTSDHGELFERGIWQHITPVLYEPVIKVPLVVGVPGQRERVDIRVPTSGVDLMPTILQLAGATQPAWCEGQVLPVSGNLEPPADRDIFSMDAKSSSKDGPLHRRTVALIKDNHKLVHFAGYDGYDDVYEMYDLEHDPEEMNDIYSSRVETASELTGILRAKWAEVAAQEAQ